MIVIVKEMFRDKYTNEVYTTNTELEVDKKRYEEIKTYVEVKETEQKVDTKKSKTKSSKNKNE